MYRTHDENGAELEYPFYEDDEEWRRYEYPRYSFLDPHEGGEWKPQAQSSTSNDEATKRHMLFRPAWAGRTQNVGGLPLPEPDDYPILSEMEALMRAAPNEEPVRVKGETPFFHEALQSLEETELDIINRLFYQRQSLREVELELGMGKTSVARTRDQALAKLRAKMNEEAVDGWT